MALAQSQAEVRPPNIRPQQLEVVGFYLACRSSSRLGHTRQIVHGRLKVADGCGAPAVAYPAKTGFAGQTRADFVKRV